MSRIKTVKNFRQTDSRWGGLGYKSKPYTMAGCGCGPTSGADIIASNPEYEKITPKTTRKYMIDHGYATNGHGTMWDGIAACLSAYGFKVTNHPDMPSFFKEMAKGGRRAIILFCGPKKNGKRLPATRGGVTWTTCGHFVAVSGYKYENKKHYLYTCDPNGIRANDGWHCYETTMKGLIPQIWSCYLPEKVKVSKNSEKLLKQAKAIFDEMKEMNFVYSNKASELSGSFKKAKTKKKKCSNCATYASWCMQGAGLIPEGEWFYCSGGKIHYKNGLTQKELEKHCTISRPNKAPKEANLQPGDVCGYEKHTQIFAGFDDKGNATWYSFGSTDPGKKMPRKRGKYNTRKVKVLIRPK